ncbi:hypothetical protein AGOR_G00112230 [Albula goreensis]|uniref:Doublecortin domain-containing protein 2 n=1 Tax=Albula goreensis TaxID=1534307 RepID=A0A8T3DGJ2_9TELE|nr:hypothetical protein AGOR_G00112230 [Albula goreensis]
MSADKPNFLSQPVVKNIFMYRNGDPYFEARRLVINEKRVSNFETFLKEVTGGIQAPYGAVRTIYTPKAGHRVCSLEHLQHGEQYVAAGKEKFKKLDYVHIGTKKKKMLQNNGQVKPVPQNRIVVSARFLKPIKEPCAIFVVANGDVLNPAVRLLIPQRVLVQYERVLEMITEKMGLRILGGVRSLYTFDGTVVNEGKDLENGQFYVAVGREKFKKLPYSELLFTKPVGVRRFIGSKAASLPPIYRFRKQNMNQVGRDQSKSMVSCSEVGDPKTSPLSQQNKEQLASIVSELSQARLMKLRQKKSGMTMTLGGQEDGEQGAGEDPGENRDNPEAQPNTSENADSAAKEKQTSEEAGETPKAPATEARAETETGAATEARAETETGAATEARAETETGAATEARAETETDTTVEEAEKPTEISDSDPVASLTANGEEEKPELAPDGEEEKNEEKNHNPTTVPDKNDEGNEEKTGNLSPVPDGKQENEGKNENPSSMLNGGEEKKEDKKNDPTTVTDTNGDENKTEKEKEDQKPEDREGKTEGQSGEGKESDEGEEKSKPAEGTPTDLGEGGQEGLKNETTVEEKAGTSTDTTQSAKDKSSNEAQKETENKEEERESKGQDEGPGKEDQAAKRERK